MAKTGENGVSNVWRVLLNGAKMQMELKGNLNFIID